MGAGNHAYIDDISRGGLVESSAFVFNVASHASQLFSFILNESFFFEIYSRRWNHNLQTNWDCFTSPIYVRRIQRFHVKLWNSPYQDSPLSSQTNGKAERFNQTFKNIIERSDHDKNMNQRQIDEAILKFLMTYRCTRHSGTEFSPSYLMLNRQVKNVFDLLRTKTSRTPGPTL